MFLAPLFLVPFVLDKALCKYLPRSISHLVLPSGIVTIELFYSFTVERCFVSANPRLPCPDGHDFFHHRMPRTVVLDHLVRLHGQFPVEEDWSLKRLVRWIGIHEHHGTPVDLWSSFDCFPKRVEKTVLVAGILLDSNFEERLFCHGL